LRATHWINAGCLFAMLASGWRVYNAAPLYAFRFPRELTLGGWLGGALQWHFASMWVLVANGLCYAAVNVCTGRLLRGLGALDPRALATDLRAALRGKLPHERGEYNAVQVFAYAAVMLALVMLVLSGLVLWKSVQFPLLRQALGGYEEARHVHFLAMAFVGVFAIGHVVLAALFPRTLLSMIRGR
jgi:thiosulfate reductase cytochrome b subunit